LHSRSDGTEGGRNEEEDEGEKENTANRKRHAAVPFFLVFVGPPLADETVAAINEATTLVDPEAECNVESAISRP